MRLFSITEQMTNSNQMKSRTLEMASTTTNPFTATTDLTTMNLTPWKEYNINWPTPFTGDRTKIKNFVQERDVYLNINDTIYNMDTAKIAFVLSFIMAGEAQK